jgi:hypothetical protein
LNNVFFVGHLRVWANVARFDRFSGVGKEHEGRMWKSQELGGSFKEGDKLLWVREKTLLGQVRVQFQEL